MVKRIAGKLRVLPHERLVSVEWSKGVNILGVVFGSDHDSNFYVCLARPELLAAGISCAGPCVNKAISKSKITFLEGAKPVEVEEETEEEE